MRAPDLAPRSVPQVSENIFDTSPMVFLQELRSGRYNKVLCTERAVLRTVAELGLVAGEGRSWPYPGGRASPSRCRRRTRTDSHSPQRARGPCRA